MTRAWAWPFSALLLLGCGASKGGNDWIDEIEEVNAPKPTERWKGNDDSITPLPSPAKAASDKPDVMVVDFGGTPRAVINDAPAEELYRNTYYDFPREGAGAKDATLYDASCAPIAPVTKAFHDQVCVQGSGKLMGGETVSFAKRDCACAAVCPRTSQKICFERLDPARFPHGRGAAGKPITPLRSVAVDTTLIPLGASVFIPDAVGLPRESGPPHDGCFVAEDRGIKVTGKHIDIFTGDPAVTARWNTLLPSNKGVRVKLNDPRCAGR